MNRKGTNRKQIKSPGVAGARADVLDRVLKIYFDHDLRKVSYKLLKEKPYLLKATYKGTIQAANNYLHQVNRQRKSYAPKLARKG